MGILADFWFGLGHFFNWTFEHLLEPIAHVSDWIFVTIGAVLIIWWLSKLAGFGNDNEKDYKGW